MDIFSRTTCQLGEGPLWHPLRNQLFWFDILSKRLFTSIEGQETSWRFDGNVSAAGWVDEQSLLIASDTGLHHFSLVDGTSKIIMDLEQDNPATRSNDGRADPWGGFWIGTMGRNAEKGAGSIYRYFKGTLRRLVSDVTISNAICFAPDRSCAYFTDSPLGVILRQPLSAKDGWPVGHPEVFCILQDRDIAPDGAVVDLEGCVWNAQWGAGRIVQYSPAGQVLSEISVPVSQVSCPAFGGSDMKTLFATTAAVDVDEAGAGWTYAVKVPVCGQQEHKIVL